MVALRLPREEQISFLFFGSQVCDHLFGVCDEFLVVLEGGFLGLVLVFETHKRKDQFLVLGVVQLVIFGQSVLNVRHLFRHILPQRIPMTLHFLEVVPLERI